MPEYLSSKKYKKLNPKLYILPSSLSEEPELSALVMQVISIWSYIENDYARIASQCLKADFEIVTSMLNSITGSEGRKAAISTAVRESHTKDEFILFQAIEDIIRPSRKKRNEFAHHVWAIAPEIPDTLCLIPPNHLTQRDASNQARKKSGLKTLGDLAVATTDTILQRADPSVVMVYTKKCLEKEIFQASEASILVSQLRLSLSDLPIVALARSRLYARSEVQQAIQQRSKRTRP